MSLNIKRNTIPWDLGELRNVIHVGARYGEELDAYVSNHGAKNILLFEPMPLHLKDLYENVDRYSGHANITVSNIALSNHSGISTITAFRGFSSGLSSLKSIDKPRMLEVFGADPRHEEGLRRTSQLEFTVPVDTLDNCLSVFRGKRIELPVDLLSIDTQGCELEVLEGASMHLSSIKNIICEVTLYPDKSPYIGVHSATEICEFLGKHGFALNRDMNLWGQFGHGCMLFESKSYYA
jgi:FkbM family methyltransferase